MSATMVYRVTACCEYFGTHKMNHTGLVVITADGGEAVVTAIFGNEQATITGAARGFSEVDMLAWEAIGRVAPAHGGRVIEVAYDHLLGDR